MSPRPLISVVIPTFNREASLGRCLSALAAQDFDTQLWEAIVVNDGGAPPSIPAGLGPAVAVRSVTKDHAGPAAARNLGLHMARGSIVAFIDDDCRAWPDWLAQWAVGFEHGTWDGLGGMTLNASPWSLGAVCHQYLIDFLYDYLRLANGDAYLLVSNNAAFRTEALRQAGGFDERFQQAAAEDRELSHRLTYAGRRLGYWSPARVWHDNPLGAVGYLRLQFRYGQGDAVFRKILTETGTPRRVGQRRRPQFHLALARRLWKERAPPAVWLLLYNAQLMHFLGSRLAPLHRSRLAVDDHGR